MSEHTFDGAHIVPRQRSLFQNMAEYPSGEDLLTRDPCAVDGIVSIHHREESKDLQESDREAEKAESIALSSIQGERGRCLDDATSSAGTISAHGANREREASSVCKHGH